MTVYPNPTVTVDEHGELPERHVCIQIIAEGQEIVTTYLTVSQAMTLVAAVASCAQAVNRQIEAHRQEQRLRADGLI